MDDEFYQDFDNFWNVLWLSSVTITSGRLPSCYSLVVGFGDFYCRSHFGRFTSVLASLLGVFTISLMLESLEGVTKFD